MKKLILVLVVMASMFNIVGCSDSGPTFDAQNREKSLNEMKASLEPNKVAFFERDFKEVSEFNATVFLFIYAESMKKEDINKFIVPLSFEYADICMDGMTVKEIYEKYKEYSEIKAKGSIDSKELNKLYNGAAVNKIKNPKFQQMRKDKVWGKY